ncbi:MAG: GlmU family protein [Bacteroidota bacterium]
MAHILFEDSLCFDLLPFTYTRSVSELRVGIFTMQSRWEKVLQSSCFTWTRPYLQEKYAPRPEGEVCTFILSTLLPNPSLIQLIQEAKPGHYYHSADGQVLVAKTEPKALPEDFNGVFEKAVWEYWEMKGVEVSLEVDQIRQGPDLFRYNAQMIAYDFPYAVQAHQPASGWEDRARVYGKDNLFVAEGASLKGVTLDAEDGPMFIGPGVQLQLGALIQRSHAFLEGAVVNMGAKMRGDTTVGPYSKVGGEVGNSMIMGYSNKGHEGYLGNSVLGYWCNLGADTNTSNLKNNYASVKIWHYPSKRFRDTGLQFCGLMMGDHSKTGINTMLNTGTVVGVCANIFGSGFPRNYVPSFSWGGASGFTTYRLEKALEVARIVMARRNLALDDTEIAVLTEVFEQTQNFRR